MIDNILTVAGTDCTSDVKTDYFSLFSVAFRLSRTQL